MTCGTLAWIAYAALAYVAYKIGKSAYKVFYPFWIAVPQSVKKLAGADWAVVTGSSDGIGKAYAFELAKKGFNIILVARSADKLNAVRNEILEKYASVQVEVVACDLSKFSVDTLKSNEVIRILNEKDIGVLVNNAGLSYEYPERLSEIDGGLERALNILSLNTAPTTVLSAVVLKQMACRNRGVIINVASSAAYFPMAYLSVYSATKKYVAWLSECLREEYSNTGIVIQAVCPMLVSTKLSKVRKSSFFVPTTDDFVKEAMRSIGYANDTTGCFAHQLQTEFLFELLPSFLAKKITTATAIQTRAMALKKKKRAAEAAKIE